MLQRLCSWLHLECCTFHSISQMDNLKHYIFNNIKMYKYSKNNKKSTNQSLDEYVECLHFRNHVRGLEQIPNQNVGGISIYLPCKHCKKTSTLQVDSHWSILQTLLWGALSGGRWKQRGAGWMQMHWLMQTLPEEMKWTRKKRGRKRESAFFCINLETCAVQW